MLDEAGYTMYSEMQTDGFFEIHSVFRKAFNFLVCEEEGEAELPE